MRRRLGRFGFWIALALLLGSGSAGAQSVVAELDRMRDERRVALVIGNGAYGPPINQLANPGNDARDIAAALDSAGFEVTLELDADRDQMRRAVIDFGLALRDGGVGLFYYSGHAVQLDGVNYMIPLGAEVLSASYVPVETVAIDDVLARMGGADNRLNIVVLDACRNNPFKGLFRSATRGLAQAPAPSGTYIAYAAAPDALALDGKGQRNSPYTAALLTALAEPGLNLEEVFKQVRRQVHESTKGFQTPWTGSSITGDFFFHLPEPAAEPQVAAPPSAPTIDMVVWDRIGDSQDPADFEIFLEVYPDSPLAPFARNRLKALQASRPSPAAVPAPEPPLTVSTLVPSAGTEAKVPAAEPEPEPSVLAVLPQASEPASAPAEPVPTVPPPDPAVVEAALGLSREQRQEIQLALTALGHDTRGADGIFGRNSRAALREWQEARGEPATGYLTGPQREKLTGAEPQLAALATARQKPEQDTPVQPAVGVYRYQPGDEFRDCPDCPLMVVVPAGDFTMGSSDAERTWAIEQGASKGWVEFEKPQHPVTIERPLAVGRYEVTVSQFEAFAQATDHDMSGACWEFVGSSWKRNTSKDWRAPGFDQTESQPVVCVSWDDASTYVAWLSEMTGYQYRLLSEAEWEYAARAGTTAMRPWGEDSDNRIGCTHANGADLTAKTKFSYRRMMNCHDGNVYTAPVGSYSANNFRLHDMIGNVLEWVDDCWHDSYDEEGRPDDGSAWTENGDCDRRVLRGGSWNNVPAILRSANRFRYNFDDRDFDTGFRVARTLSPSESVSP
jgi:formylglycine-generating enzyme required for sulfatase activity